MGLQKQKRRKSGNRHCHRPVHPAALGQAGPLLLRRGRQHGFCQYAGHQRPAHQVPGPSAVQHPGGHRRLRVLPARWLRLSQPRQRRGNERHCLLHHRRHHADRRRGQCGGHLLRGAVPEHHQEHRVLPRPGRGMVDEYHRRRHDLPVPADSERGASEKEQDQVVKLNTKARSWIILPML